MEWSPTKQQVFAFESDIVVSAGAGSGKTAALVELYLRLLAGETRFPRLLKVEEIVAITFTDKAALEMMERVRSGITRRLDRGDDPRFWANCLRTLSVAPISTFHSFCARLLRENPAEAGVDPAFTLLDELAARGELKGALGEVIEVELRDRTPGIRLLLDQYPLSGAGRGKGLGDYLLDLRRKLSTCGRNAEELLRITGQWDDQARETFRVLPGRIDTCAARIGSAIGARALKGGKEPAFLGKMRDLLALCRTVHLAAENDDTLAVVGSMLECMKGSWGKDDAPLREEIRDFLESVKRSFYQLEGAPVAAALIDLSEKLEKSYRSRKARRGVLDFDDLQLRTRDLLKNDASVRADCRLRFPVIMVDEFQDTNPLQKELLELLRDEGQRIFIVGDPKQSIYLFRGADVSVFGRTRAEVSRRGGQSLFFQESFRSREGIIAFVNRLFSEVMGEGGRSAKCVMRNAEYGEGASECEARDIGGYDVRYAEGDHLQPVRLDWDGTPCVELLAMDSEESSGEKRRAEARAVARKILRIVSGEDGVRVFDKTPQSPVLYARCLGASPQSAYTPRQPGFGDIAILFRRFTHLKLFEQELRNCAIPYYVVKGKGFYRCQEVLDLLNFLRYLEFRGDFPALAGLLRSPLCGVSDETLYLLSRLEGGISAWDTCFPESRVPPAGRSPSAGEGPSPGFLILDRIDPLDREKLRSLALLVGRLRPLRDRLTLAELMEEILVGTDFVSTLYATFQGEQKAANLRKLIELSRSFTGEGEGGLRGFVAYLNDLVQIEPTEAEAVISAEEENVVRLMTIHQSKGLEFPVVFIPELGAGSPVENAPVQFDHDLGVGVKCAGTGGSWEQTIASRTITEVRNRQEAAERKRLFYVATTRARDYLVLSGEKGRTGAGSWRDWVDGFIEGEGRSLMKVTESRDSGLRPQKGFCPQAGLGTDTQTTVIKDWGTGNRESGLENGKTGNGKRKSGYSPEALVVGLRRSLQYTAPLPSTMVFSPTALEDYETCPRKYYYRAVMGLDEGLFAELLAPSSVRLRKSRGRGMTPLEKGDLAHLIMERIDFAADAGAVRAACAQTAAVAASEPEDAGVREVVDNVVSFVSSPLGRALADRKLMREWPFTLKLEGEAAYFIRGAMDLVVPEADHVTVYDYKYLNRENADLEGYRFQLRTYMLALARAWPEKRTGGKLVFLKGGAEEVVECEIPAFEAGLIRIMDAIRNRSIEEDFGLRDGCDGTHCPFRQRCLGRAA